MIKDCDIAYVAEDLDHGLSTPPVSERAFSPICIVPEISFILNKERRSFPSGTKIDVDNFSYKGLIVKISLTQRSWILPRDFNTGVFTPFVVNEETRLLFEHYHFQFPNDDAFIFFLT